MTDEGKKRSKPIRGRGRNSNRKRFHRFSGFYEFGFCFCFVLYCFVLYCFVLHCFVLFCYVLFVLFCFVLLCIVLYCFVLFCIVLYCFIRNVNDIQHSDFIFQQKKTIFHVDVHQLLAAPTSVYSCLERNEMFRRKLLIQNHGNDRNKKVYPDQQKHQNY